MQRYNDEESQVGKGLKYTLDLLYLPPSEVGESLCDLIAVAPAEVTDYADYLVESYIELYFDFSPYVWAEPPTSAPRTTESFHSSFKKEFYPPHPFIHAVMFTLRGIQVSSYFEIKAIKRGKVQKLKAETAGRIEKLKHVEVAKWERKYCSSKRYNLIHPDVAYTPLG